MNKKSAGGSTKSEDFPKDESRSTSQSSVTPLWRRQAISKISGNSREVTGSTRFFLVAQEPHWLFTYWDIDITRHPGGKTLLRVYESEEVLEAEIEVPFETRNWYIPVTKAGSNYVVEIGYYRGDVWNPLARSVGIQTPPEGLSESDKFDYATIPFHVSFQKPDGECADGRQPWRTACKGPRPSSEGRQTSLLRSRQFPGAPARRAPHSRGSAWRGFP